jgi:hypothetical protein
MTTLKDQLLKLFDGKNTKSYGRLVTCRPELLKEIKKISDELHTESISETLWCIINDQMPPFCQCGNPRKFNTFILGYRNFCSSKNGKCSSSKEHHSRKISEFWQNNPESKISMLEKRNKTVMEIYGVKNAVESELVQKKFKATNIEKYGVEYPLQSEIIRNKSKQTTKQNFGVEYALQSEEIRQKAKESFDKNNPGLSDRMQIARESFIKVNGTNPFAVPSIKQKIHETLEARYGYTHAKQEHLSPEVIQLLENRDLFIQAVTGLTVAEASIKLGVNETTIARRSVQHDCRDIFAKSCRSKWEYKLAKFLISLGLVENIDFIRSDRKVLNGKELDFYFPKVQAAIEVGSLFYHSEITGGRGQRYHFDKWFLCKQQGIDLYQYWDYEMQDKWAVIESKVRYLFNKIEKSVGARKITRIDTISVTEEKSFLQTNHIQGFSPDRMLSLGAYVGDHLVAIMALDFKGNDIEITRYATDINCNYPGLFSKILKFALNKIGNTSGKRLISYADNRHSNGNVYKQNGFKIGKSKVSEYYYTKNYHSIERKSKFTRNKIAKKFGVDISGKTEWQLMQELGYDRIWDAGKQLWIKLI